MKTSPNMHENLMRQTLRLIMALAFLFIVSRLGQAQEETKTLFQDFLKGADIAVTGSTSFYSKYMWRGFRLDDDYVLQPSINISAFKGWNLNIWSSFDTDNSADSTNSDETDTTLTYTHKIENLKILGMSLKPVGITVGHVYYDFPGTNTFSKESLLGFSYEIFLSPSLSWYHDYSRESQGGGDGDYLVLNLTHSLPLIKKYGISLDLSGHVGYNKHLFIRGEGGDILATTGITVPLTKNLTFSPTVNYNAPFGGMSDKDDGNKDPEFFWGTTLTYNF